MNHERKVVIFGAFESVLEGTRQVILEDHWAHDDNGRRKAGYPQSLEHTRLIRDEGYKLQTFVQYDGQRNENSGSTSIAKFSETLEDKVLVREGAKWYADPKGGLIS